jgi:ribosomal protein S18 acetylase RimI-like enzyme
VVEVELITPQRAMIFKDVRLRALQDSPTAFSSRFERESKLSDSDWINRAKQWTSPDAVGYLAIDGGKACGIAAGMIDKDDAARAHLLSMWVAQTHRRAGVGRSLVEAVLEWARTMNVRTMHLLVTSNNSGAIEFYRQLGFALTNWTEPYVNDPALLNYEMIQPLS